MEGEDGEEWRKLPCEDRIAHKVINLHTWKILLSSIILHTWNITFSTYSGR